MGLLVCGWFSTQAHAQSIILNATEFTEITDSPVPYYIDNAGDRNVLAIDAAVVAYRDEFARAVTTFNGPAGNYRIVLATLGEIDGEGEYRLLVNGSVEGTAVNSPVAQDWGEQLFIFRNIPLQPGYQIAVESKAVSNGLIPENDEFAYARGRWRSLQLSLEPDTLTLEPATSLKSLITEADMSGDWLAGVEVQNASSQAVAGEMLTITPAMQYPYDLLAPAGCFCIVDQVNCPLPELQSGQTHRIDLRVINPVHSIMALDLALSSGINAAQYTWPATADFAFTGTGGAQQVSGLGICTEASTGQLPDVDSNGIPDVTGLPDENSSGMPDTSGLPDAAGEVTETTGLPDADSDGTQEVADLPDGNANGISGQLAAESEVNTPSEHDNENENGTGTGGGSGGGTTSGMILLLLTTVALARRKRWAVGY